MQFLIANLWGWMLAALALGLIIGWITCARDKDSWFSGWVPIALVLFVAGLAAALLAWLPGRAGYWLETALLMFAAYIAGCCAGCWFKQLTDGGAGATASAALPAAGAAAAAAALAPRVPAPAQPPRPPAPAPAYAGGQLTPLPEPVLSALRLRPQTAAPAAAPAAAPPPRPAAGAAPATAPRPVVSAAAPPAGGPVTPLPEPVLSALRLRPQTAPAPAAVAAAAAPAAAAQAAPQAAPAAPARAEAALPPARPVAPPAPAAAGGPPTGLPEPVASALRQRLSHTAAPVAPHPMAGLPRPAAAVAPPPAPAQAAAAAGPAPTVRPAPAGVSAQPSAGLPEPVASALRQSIPQTDGVSARLAGAGVRVTSGVGEEPAKPAAVTIAHSAASGSVVLEAHVGEVTAQGAGAQPDGAHPGARPKGLSGARGAGADDLIQIKGVGPRNEEVLHSLGIYHFDQIAHWTPQESEWVGSYMKFSDRVEREHWIGQCRLLAAGGDTEHSLAVKAGKFSRDASADSAVSAADAAALRASLADVAPHVADEDKHEGKRPFGLAKPRGGKADDLKRVRGIGPQNEGRLHALGIWHFDQIARWTHDNVLWVGSFLAFPGRIDREDWLAQAAVLATGKDTEFSRRADAGLVATSKDDGSKGQSNVAPPDRDGGSKG